MTEKVSVEIEGQTFELDISKMNGIIDKLKSVKSSAERNMKKGKYNQMIDSICFEKFEINMGEKPTNEQRITIANEMI